MKTFNHVGNDLKELKTEKDVIKAYRNYYINEKSRFAVWKHASQPDWYNEGVKNANIRL